MQVRVVQPLDVREIEAHARAVRANFIGALLFALALGRLDVVEPNVQIAAASEVLYAGVRGEASWGQVVGGYLLPTLVGNTARGITMMAAINHAQATSGQER